MVIAQTIRINGRINGTSYTVAIAFDVGSSGYMSRNLYYCGLSFATRKGAVMNRDLVAFSLGGTMLSQTNGNIKAVIGPYEILIMIFDALKIKVQLPDMIYDEPGVPLTAPEVMPTFKPTQSTGGISSLFPGRQMVTLQLP